MTFIALILMAALVAAFAILIALAIVRRIASRRTPLKRAREAVEARSEGERERLRQWLDDRWPRGRGGDHGEGITR
jgi:hypothetical protein